MIGRRLQLLGLCLAALAGSVAAFLPPQPAALATKGSSRSSGSSRAKGMVLAAAVDDAAALVTMPKAVYLASLPDTAKTMQAEWQYMLVERMEAPTQTSGGLFLPSDEKDPLHVVRVVSFGGGIVGESGVTAPLEGIAPGDVAFIKQPWGIGPRDDIWDGRKFSFVRQNDVLSRIQSQ